jgi:mRNA interferase RelE/StbE
MHGLKTSLLSITMAYKLHYHPDVKRSDLPKIDAKNKDMIKRAIEKPLSTLPKTAQG